jgi:hypothetical protein
MRVKRAFGALAAAVLLASVAYAQAPSTQEPQSGGNPDAPRFKVEVFGDAMAADFTARVSNYVELRNKLAQGLPALTVGNPAEVRKAVHALAARIRVVRADARRGDIFTPLISNEMKKVLSVQLDDSSWADLVDDNPGEFAKRVNASYPEERPYSTVPANILAVLPPLPEHMEYRFIGPHLGLLDTRAGVIVDWIPYALTCAESDDKSKCHK